MCLNITDNDFINTKDKAPAEILIKWKKWNCLQYIKKRTYPGMFVSMLASYSAEQRKQISYGGVKMSWSVDQPQQSEWICCSGV